MILELPTTNHDFENWISINQNFLKNYDFNSEMFEPFPSNQFEDHFYFWLFKLKNRILNITELPWWKHAPVGAGTDWPFKTNERTNKLHEEYENWWLKNYPNFDDRYNFLNKFYDYVNDKPFDLKFYKSNLFSKDKDAFSEACRGLRYRYDWFFSLVTRTSEILDIRRECENIVRQSYGVPKIGEGWVSETSLFYLVKTYFENDTEVIHHASPDFLGRQHYDIYIPEYKIAIEYQGAQHHKPIEYFGGEEAFVKNQERDKRKKEISRVNGVVLFEVLPNYDEKKVLNKISNVIKDLKKKI